MEAGSHTAAHVLHGHAGYPVGVPISDATWGDLRRLAAEGGWVAPTHRRRSHAPHTAPVNTIDEMLHLDLLSPAQHAEITTWLQTAKTPEAILAMPPELWRALESASVAMNIDADLMRPPLLSADV